MNFEDIDNIIFDGGLWRNDIGIWFNKLLSVSGEIILEEYKGTRDPDKSIDWDVIFKGYGDFIGKLNSAGITTCREKNVEGDD